MIDNRPDRPQTHKIMYAIDGCWPQINEGNRFLTPAMIELLRCITSVEESGHIVDRLNKRLYVLMANNELAIVGMETGYLYRIAKLKECEVLSLGIHRS